MVFLRGEAAFLTEPLASDATDYSYGVDHRIIAARYADEPASANRVQVFGKDVFAERFDWAGVAALHDRLAQAVDTNLTTAAQVEARGDALLRHAAMASAGGEITAPVNCGLELFDVIEVTDPLAGLSAAKRRVLGLSLRYSANPGVYQQRVWLGGV